MSVHRTECRLLSNLILIIRMNATKSVLDKEIMNVFEEQEDKFIFPITSQKDARDFVKLLNKHGCSYESICKEVNEDEENFREWRLGGGTLEIGKHVIDRINKPFRTMFSESENDDKDRRNSLNEFYQFSFDDEEVFASTTNKTPKIEIDSIPPTKETDSSNFPNDKSKNNIPTNNSSQANISSIPKEEIVTSQHQTSSVLKKPICVESAKRSPKTTPSSSPIAARKVIEAPTSSTDKEKTRTPSPSREKQVSTAVKQTQETNHQINKPREIVTKSSAEKASNQTEIRSSSPKPSSAPTLTTPTASSPKHSSTSSATSSKPETPKQTSQTSTIEKSTTTTSTKTNKETDKETYKETDKETNEKTTERVEEERPPSPVTTSPHYQPYAATFTAEDVEPMLNYNSDDQSDEDGPGFIYMFSDIPSPTMKVSKYTKFRVKVGTSKNPLKRLQQALVFNPDIRMLASIPVKSRKSCKLMLKEGLKSMLMKNRADWYWTTLNAIFSAINVVLQNNN